MTTPGAPEPQDPYVAVLVQLARMEGKIDAAVAAHGTKIEELARRQDKADNDILKDIQPRLRAVEARPSVSPRALLAGLASVAAIIAALTPFLDKLYS
jgi:hypothetical protein